MKALTQTQLYQLLQTQQVPSSGGGGGGTPGGSTTQVQYNNAGAFAGNAGFTYDSATNTVTFANLLGPPGPGNLSIATRTAFSAGLSGGTIDITTGAGNGVGGQGGSMFFTSGDGNVAGGVFQFQSGGDGGDTGALFVLGSGGGGTAGGFSMGAGYGGATVGGDFLMYLGGGVISDGNMFFQDAIGQNFIHLRTAAPSGAQQIGFFNNTPTSRPTTSSASATRVAVAGTAANVGDTYDGYTLARVVKALRDLGLLA